MRALLRDRNARLYLDGQVMSLFGDSALWLAMAIWIKVLTGSSSAAGLSWFALAAGSLFGPLGGMLADRFRRLPLLVATNLATAGLVLLLLLVHDRQQVWLIYTVMFGYGVSGSLLGLGRTDAAFTFCYAVPQTVAIAAGAGLIAAVSYRVMLLIIAAIMTLAAGYLATRRDKPSDAR